MIKKLFLSASLAGLAGLLAGCSTFTSFADGETLVKNLVKNYIKSHPDILKLKEQEIEKKINTWVNEQVKKELSKLSLEKPTTTTEKTSTKK